MQIFFSPVVKAISILWAYLTQPTENIVHPIHVTQRAAHFAPRNMDCAVSPAEQQLSVVMMRLERIEAKIDVLMNCQVRGAKQVFGNRDL